MGWTEDSSLPATVGPLKVLLIFNVYRENADNYQWWKWGENVRRYWSTSIIYSVFYFSRTLMCFSLLQTQNRDVSSSHACHQSAVRGAGQLSHPAHRHTCRPDLMTMQQKFCSNFTRVNADNACWHKCASLLQVWAEIWVVFINN